MVNEVFGILNLAFLTTAAMIVGWSMYLTFDVIEHFRKEGTWKHVTVASTFTLLHLVSLIALILILVEKFQWIMYG